MKLLEHIEERINILKESLANLQNQVNAHMGAIQELERIKKEFEIKDLQEN